MSKSGECKLCGATRKLLKSHIVPKAFYDTNDDLKIASNEYEDLKRSPVGVYDTFLCNDCEKYFGEFDHYGISLFRAEKEICSVERTVEIIKTVNNQNPDIQKAKLFFLSILWRAHCCQQDMFKQVKLGIYSDLIKEILLNKTQLELNDYSVICTKYPVDSKGYEKLCYHSRRERLDHIVFYQFSLGNIGYQFYIKVDSQPIPKALEEYNLGYTDYIRILVMEELKDKNLSKVIDILKPN